MLPGFVLGLTLHEFSHAWVANRLGDDTARRLGRLTLNPLPHLDLFGTMMLIVAGFGWAKPVPVNAANLRSPRRDMALVAVAGPISNIIIAFFCALVLRLAGLAEATGAVAFAVYAIWINVVLAVFNMIPLPPLDGSRILAFLVPQSWNHGYATFEKYGPMLLFGLVLLASFTGVSILGRIVNPVAAPLVNLLLGGAAS